MARKIRFRKKRLYNLKIFVVMSLFFLIVISGLVAVDITKSYVLYGQPRLEMIRIQEVEKDIYQVSLFNNTFDLNLKYLRRDMGKIKGFFD
ncbi:hypothetical protein [Ruminiclostridium cellobioparum]|uniref:hypothetical protein n=1 Tax=Ruminiclostridium cellobioparum TaxID=29355 RepID=UPI0004898A13|nr:hypothetical protein [Ruminiclostridium cellobioparum]